MVSISRNRGLQTHVPLMFQTTQLHSDDDDDNSFGLLNSSFDTMEGADDAFGIGRDDAMFSPSKDDGEKDHGQGNLTPESRMNNDGLSMGDISPIKLIYNSDASGPNDHGTTTHMRHDVSHDGASVVPVDWRNDHQAGHSPYPVVSNPLSVLKTVRGSFHGMKYRLPHLKVSGCVSPIDSAAEKKNDTDVDAKIATRRIEAAVCAFGGTVSHTKKQKQSIFRPKGASSDAKQKYETQLHQRYELGVSEVTWDVEEDPPVKTEVGSPTSTSKEAAHGKPNVPAPKKAAGRQPSSSSDDDPDSPGSLDQITSKMKYRCKLCGQLKQNHVCPFNQPLQRSIGVMVFPAVNSYTAAEPGTVAAPLTKMNNFVSYDSDQTSPQPHGDERSGVPCKPRVPGYPTAIIYETMKDDDFYNSPQSSLSAPSSEDALPHQSSDNKSEATAVTGKRPHCQMVSVSSYESSTNHPPSKRAPFVQAVSLRAEHYRAVTPMTSSKHGSKGPTTTSTAYEYTPIPLTFQERKRLSDTLFHLARQDGCMMQDCAAVLREARQKYEWDLAVAELMTQVVVGLYCSENDARLDGLQQYLLTLGISC